MKKYRVSLGFVQWDDYYIEAETEEDALEKGRELYEEGVEADGLGEPSRADYLDEAYVEEEI